MEHFCECGCGGQTKQCKNYPYNWNSFIFGHQCRGKHHSIDTKQKMAKSHIGKKHSLETIQKMEEGQQRRTFRGEQRHHSEETKKKLRLAWETKKGKGLVGIYGEKRANQIIEKIKKGQAISIKPIGNSGHKFNCKCCICKVQKGEDLKCKFMGIYFDSQQEKEVAKILFNSFEIIPIEDVNVHVKVKGKIIDFYLFGFFIEYHPKVIFFKKNKKVVDELEEYFQKRRNALDNSGFRDTILIHLKNVKEAKVLCNFLDVLKNKKGS